MFLQNGKEPNESNRRIKNYRKYTGNAKFRDDIFNAVLKNSVGENIGSENIKYFPKSSLNRFIDLFGKNYSEETFVNI